MLVAEPTGHDTLSDELERQRLMFRARRLERVVNALQQRVHLHEGDAVPVPLRIALRDFRAELAELRARIA